MEKTPVLIIGGGVAGLSAALALSRMGLPSTLVERSPALGGQVAGFCCKAAPVCSRCGACRLGDLLSQTAERPEINILSQALPVKAKRSAGSWQVKLDPRPGKGLPSGQPGTPLSENLDIEARAVILAVGHTPFDPAKKTRFGFGRVPGVVTASKLESELAAGPLPEDVKRVAFIQCVGSRDESLGHLFCSRVCCGFALRLAAMIKDATPDKDVTFFHMDVQSYGRAWEEDLPALREKVEFVRGMPGEVRQGETGCQVVYAGEDGSPKWAEFDRVVLSAGLMPPPGAASLQELFGISLDRDGFLGPDQGPVSGAKGVFVAGSANAPRSIVESIDHAALAASAALAHFREASRG